MSKVFSDFDIRQTGESEWQLLKDFTYIDSKYGAIVVPAGFKTNFASIESLRVPLFPVYAMLANMGDQASTIHDYLYSGYPILVEGREHHLWRAEVDALFRRALIQEGVATWRAWLFWQGVRFGGKDFFSLKKKRLGE